VLLLSIAINGTGAQPTLVEPRVSLGSDHVLHLSASGRMLVFDVREGVGKNGAKGPFEFAFPLDVSAISAGGQHFFALGTDGRLWGWGSNRNGELGLQSISSSEAPVMVGIGPWNRVSAGWFHTLAIQMDGTLWGWGQNSNGHAGVDQLVKTIRMPTLICTNTSWGEVSAGSIHSLGLQTNGTLWSWGDNRFGKLGTGNDAPSRQPVRIGQDTNWVAVSAGVYHSLALQKDGSLYAWGWNKNGQLGNGTENDALTPTLVGSPRDWKVVSAGNQFSTGIKKDGSLWAWGWNRYGQLGNEGGRNEHRPVRIDTGNQWVSVAASTFFSAGVQSDGTLWIWGTLPGSREALKPTQL
jgi:alpha-tubulin suppressor-like RCC1 family protein